MPLSYRLTNPGNEPWRNYVLPGGSISMQADLSAAFGEVIAAIVKGCPDGAERREAITEVMRVHRRNFGPC